ncbi:DNA-binding ferritin-like protein (Dps family) [Neobacillus niacini]|nr:DNA-binding ferritin-like protein (Dps family) [Neobacillus niacini]
MLEMFKKMIGDKKEYKMMMARVEALPTVYQLGLCPHRNHA